MKISNKLFNCILLLLVNSAVNLSFADRFDDIFRSFEYKTEDNSTQNFNMDEEKKRAYQDNIDDLNKELAEKEIGTGRWSNQEEKMLLEQIEKLQREIEELKEEERQDEIESNRTSTYLNFRSDDEDNDISEGNSLNYGY